MSFIEDVDEIIAQDRRGLLGIHETWSRIRLGDVARIVNGYPFESRYFSRENGAPLLRIRDIVPGQTETFYRGPLVDGFWVEPGDLVVGMDGDFNSRLWRGPRALLNQRVCKISPDERHYSLRFLSYALPGYLHAVNERTSSITVKHLSSKTVGDLPVPLPPRPQQDRIAAKIDELFSDIEEGERCLARAQELLKRYRQSVLKAAVTGELTRDWRDRAQRGKNAGKGETGADLLRRILAARRAAWEEKSGGGKSYVEPEPPNTSGLPELPEEWVWATVDQLASLVQYGSSAKCNGNSTGVPVLRMGNIFEGEFDTSDLKFLPNEHEEFPDLLLEKGDLLFNRTNSAELVGKSAVYDGRFERCSFASYLIRARFILCSPQFVGYFINSVFGRRWIASVVSQQVGQANVNGSKLRALAVPLPPIHEQNLIVDRVAELNDASAMSVRDIASSDKTAGVLRQSILRAAFSGKLVPQDPSDEPASVLLERIAAARASGPAGAAKPRARRR